MYEYTKAPQFHAVIGQGPWREVLVTKEPRADGLRPTDAGYRGMVTVSEEPTGVTYKTWTAVNKSLAAKNAIAQNA